MNKFLGFMKLNIPVVPTRRHGLYAKYQVLRIKESQVFETVQPGSPLVLGGLKRIASTTIVLEVLLVRHTDRLYGADDATHITSFPRPLRLHASERFNEGSSVVPFGPYICIYNYDLALRVTGNRFAHTEQSTHTVRHAFVMRYAATALEESNQ
jgi:hypothetical protein